MKKIKSFFATPARAVISTLSIVVLLSVLGIVIFHGAGFSVKGPSKSGSEEPLKRQIQGPSGYTTVPSGTNPASVRQPAVPETSYKESGQITLEEAKAAALLDAGLSDGDVTYLKTELDYDDRVPVYDIEFYTASHEYEYEILAHTGEICHRSQEAYRHHSTHHNSDQDGQLSATGVPGSGETGESSDISQKTAESLALEHAGVSIDDVVFIKTELDYENGRMVYEIEFFKDRMEYEYEIDGTTGEILKFHSEYDD